VEESFAAGRPARRLLVTPQRRQALEKIVLHATTLRIPIVEVEGGSLTALAGFDGHQGVAVVVDARRFASVEDILARSIERSEPAFVVVLDSLEDPQNVGTLLRSAEGAGVHGVVFPTERQAPLSPAAVKASAGATEHLLLAPVDDLAGTLTDLHLRGVRIVGSEADASLTAREADLRGPIALVVGSEGHGLSPAVRRRCDLFVRLPMRGVIGSLNAAVAGSILLFEILGQRDVGGTAPDRPPRSSPATRARSAASKGPVPDAATEPDATEAPMHEADPDASDRPIDAAELGATQEPVGTADAIEGEHPAKQSKSTARGATAKGAGKPKAAAKRTSPAGSQSSESPAQGKSPAKPTTTTAAPKSARSRGKTSTQSQPEGSGAADAATLEPDDELLPP
jgi:23S rRNA (guanosine2251-2'-O)-methyltransferase